ncbi:MAG: trypsin-like peptidase domain-containing protein, partial [Limisphaerales bacterium]
MKLTNQIFRQLIPGLVLMLASAPVGASEPDVRRDAAVLATEQVLPSVVNIATESVIEYHDWYDDLLRRFYGRSSDNPVREEQSLGSGVIIDEEGYVLTNYHVVRRATRIQVKLWDGREYEAEPVVATEGTDVALLKLKTKPGEKFKSIRFAADDDLLLGETVLALGNPYGLGGSVTKGILSSKNRRPANGNEPLNVQDWLQTDAAINPGNSGGPLVNLRGELIGLNVAVYMDEQGQRGMGVGFSIPVKQISAALSRFFTPEVTDSLWFGAQIKSTSGSLVVASVQPGSPAARAGLQAGDRVMEVNGHPTRHPIDCNRLLVAGREHSPTLAVARGSERRSLKVQMRPIEDLVRHKLGMTLQQDPLKAGRRPLGDIGDGMYIDDVDRNGPAAQAGLTRGYLLTSVEGQKATNLKT